MKLDLIEDAGGWFVALASGDRTEVVDELGNPLMECPLRVALRFASRMFPQAKFEVRRLIAG